MEIKKNISCDLERRRRTGLLLGLVLVLSIFFVALEYSENDDSTEIDTEMLAMILQDEQDLVPLVVQRELPKANNNERNILSDDFEIDEITTENQESEPENDNNDLLESANDNEADVISDTIITPIVLNSIDNHIVEELPEFPGGASSFVKWLTENLKYPASARIKKIQGKVVAQFIVDADGAISNLKITETLDWACDKEALRVLQKMPKWRAGTRNGEPCRTMVSVPIVFHL